MDDSLSFCLQDGASLLDVSDAPSSFDPGATLTLSKPERRKLPTSAVLVGITVIATVLLLGLGGIGVWLLLKNKDEDGNNRLNNATSKEHVNENQNGMSSNSNGNSVSASEATPTVTTAPSLTDTSSARNEVMGLLNGWLKTIREGNVDERMKYYADKVDIFYNENNISADKIRLLTLRAFSKYSTFDMQLSNINIDIDSPGTHAVITFDKKFDFRGEKNVSGAVLSKLWLGKIGGNWVITGEMDLKTYYANTKP
jgi:hypothetical protein